LIEAYKIISGKGVDSSKFFTWASVDHGLRGHQFKTYKHSSHLNIRITFFSQSC